MESASGPADLPPPSRSPEEQLIVLRELVTAATQRLLGDTITVSDPDWRGPSRLPGWTRGHVATHLARHAEALSGLLEAALRGERVAMYPSDEERDAAIEAGAGRTSLELQIDLDTTAGRLGTDFERLEEARAWDTPVELRDGREAPAGLLPLARLSEVVLHHVDLDVGFEVDDIDRTTADWLLEWCAFRLSPRVDFPPLVLLSDTGLRVSVGAGSAPAREIRAASPRLLGWLTGRSSAEAVDGGAGIVLPSY